MPKYQATITFEADRQLSGEEMDTLILQLAVQVEEPTDRHGEPAKWSSRHVDVELGRR